LLDLDSTALAMVCEGVRTKHKEGDALDLDEDQKLEKDHSYIQVQVSQEKEAFMSKLCETNTGFARLYGYEVADLAQDFRQYLAVNKS
jgi:hypothetical protein